MTTTKYTMDQNYKDLCPMTLDADCNNRSKHQRCQ